MKVEEYLEATKSSSVQERTGSIGEVESDLDEEEGRDLNDQSFDDPKHRFHEIDAVCLHEHFSKLLQIEYLAAVPLKEDNTTFQKRWTGKVIDPNHRFVVALPCRRATPCPPGVNFDQVILPCFRHVVFLVDTSSPKSYLSVEAMQALSSSSSSSQSEDETDNFSTRTIPDFMDIELASGAKAEFLLSPRGFSEVNVLGGSILRLVDLSTNVKESEFLLHFL